MTGPTEFLTSFFLTTLATDTATGPPKEAVRKTSCTIYHVLDCHQRGVAVISVVMETILKISMVRVMYVFIHLLTANGVLKEKL